MKSLLRLLFFIFLSLFFQNAYSQNRIYKKVTERIRDNYKAIETPLFSVIDDKNGFKEYPSPIDTMTKLAVNSTTLKDVLDNSPEILALTIPTSKGQFLTVDLLKNTIHSNTYNLSNHLGNTETRERSVHYRGIIRGGVNSIVALSFNENNISGFISEAGKNYEIGKIKESSTYVIYDAMQLNKKWACRYQDDDTKLHLSAPITKEMHSDSPDFVNCRPIEIYFEADYATYLFNGASVSSTEFYVNSIFNQAAALYENEGIQIVISEIKVWDTEDPYSSASTSLDYIIAFDNHLLRNFNGDLAHALSVRNIGGGIASINTLCEKGIGVSGNLDNYTPSIPNYSWNAMVVTHEIGHNLGSRHTQWCGWDGGPIDNCVSPEGPCLSGPAPINGGTIMSYCHLTSYGINLANGFGPLPGNTIRSAVQSCIGSSVKATDLQALKVSATSAVLSWKHANNTPFTLEYKLESESSWTTLPGIHKNIEIGNLIPNSLYQWRVKTGCAEYATSSFNTNSDHSYSKMCTPSYDLGCGYYTFGIEDFYLNNTAWTYKRECTPNPSFLNIRPDYKLIIGDTNTFNITLMYGYQSMPYVIWVDLNNNGIFEQNENLYISENSSPSMSGQFSIPAAASPATQVRMRVMIGYRHLADRTNPCGSFELGTTEDYLVDLVNPSTPCENLVNLSGNFTSGDTVIEARESVGKIIANNHVTTNANVTYRAASVELTPGFKAEGNIVFKATVGGCN